MEKQRRSNPWNTVFEEIMSAACTKATGPYTHKDLLQELCLIVDVECVLLTGLSWLFWSIVKSVLDFQKERKVPTEVSGLPFRIQCRNTTVMWNCFVCPQFPKLGSRKWPVCHLAFFMSHSKNCSLGWEDCCEWNQLLQSGLQKEVVKSPLSLCEWKEKQPNPIQVFNAEYYKSTTV